MYRAIGDIELKHKKNYEMLIVNSVKFIKSDMTNKAKETQKMQEGSSGSGSGSDPDFAQIPKKSNTKDKRRAMK